MPTLGITRALVDRGHDVRLLGHESIAERCGNGGARFVPLSRGEARDAMQHQDAEAEVRHQIEDLFFSSTIAGDLAHELNREPADAVLVDCTLFTAIDVALASGTPTATLFHTPYTIFRAGPLLDMFAPGIPIANAHRTRLGLPAIRLRDRNCRAHEPVYRTPRGRNASRNSAGPMDCLVEHATHPI